jgi:hypothetical protein
VIPAALAVATLIVLSVTVASGVLARWEGADEGALKRHLGAAIFALVLSLVTAIATLANW